MALDILPAAPPRYLCLHQQEVIDTGLETLTNSVLPRSMMSSVEPRLPLLTVITFADMARGIVRRMVTSACAHTATLASSELSLLHPMKVCFHTSLCVCIGTRGEGGYCLFPSVFLTTKCKEPMQRKERHGQRDRDSVTVADSSRSAWKV